jgi:sulfite reductase (NADPH) flavoprotein alpha-component
LRIYLALIILLAYALLCVLCWRYYRRKSRGGAKAQAASQWLIAYASQSGTAAQLAMRTRDQLVEADVPAQVVALNTLDEERLRQCRKALFIVSTFGEGQAPDSGNRFLPRLEDLDLSHLQYGLLALGDRSYRYFCGFGRAVNQALHTAGAVSIFDMIEVDDNDPAALRHWQYYLGQISGQSLFHDWKSADYESWQLQHRTCLNAGSPGAPAFYLQLAPPGAVHVGLWQAGDIAEIGPCNSDERLDTFLRQLRPNANTQALSGLRAQLHRFDLSLDEKAIKPLRSLADEEVLAALSELPHREYSIASIPQSGSLDLLIRQVKDERGELGLGSGWMTHHAREGEKILLRIRRNPHFHPPRPQVPLILIGNGTGMAGLRAHLQARRRDSARQNWLLFGERTAAHDFFFRDEILALQTEGFLQHLDLVFSRDAAAGEPRYVQDLLPINAERLQQWIAAGAAVYVCGSLQGMAQGVDQALSDILGRQTLDELAESLRYCRDVY